MPLVPRTGTEQSIMTDPEPKPVSPTWGETFNASFHLENDVLNAMEWFSKPAFEDDPLYDNIGHMKTSKYWDTGYRDNFVGVRSEKEFNFIAQKIEDENRYREIRDRAGMAGWATDIVAGGLSPTIFMPFGAVGRTALQVAKIAALAGTGALLQEIPLAVNQETRTAGEIGFSIAASTVLGGLLGGAAAVLKPGEREAIEAGMAFADRAKYISPNPRGVNAQATEELADPGMIKGRTVRGMATALDSNPISRSPVTDNLTSEFVQQRIGMAQISDAGLVTENNALFIPTTEGGTIENRVNIWYGNFATFAEGLDGAYARYVFEGDVPTLAPNVRARARGYAAAEKLSAPEFRKQVWWATVTGDKHENPFVQEVAQLARKSVYDPVLKGLQETKILGQELPKTADNSYVNWVFNHEQIVADPAGFVKFLEGQYNAKLQEDFATQLEKVNFSGARDEELLSDLARPADEIARLRDELGNQLKGVEARREEQQFTALQDTIDNLRASAKSLKEGGVIDNIQRRQMLADAKDMEAQAGPQFKETKLERREIKRRLSNLNKAAVSVEARLEKKLAKIDNAEELSLNGLNRVARTGQKFLNEMENWTDEVLDEKIVQLRNTFEATAKAYDRGEERLAKIIQGDEEKIGPLPIETPGVDPALLKADALQQAKADKMTSVAERLADAEDLGRDAMRDLIDETMQDVLRRVQKINDRRAVRTERLRAQAAELGPEVVPARMAKIAEKKLARETDFAERIRVQGGDNIDLPTGKVDFTEYAKEAARATKHKILGTFLRLPVVEMMQSERGSALPRMLGFIKSTDMAPWLEQDIEKVMRTYLRTMGPDIEVARKFKTVDASEQIDKMGKELDDRIDAVPTEILYQKDKKGLLRQPNEDRGKPVLDKNGKPKLKFDTPAKQRKEVERLQSEHKLQQHNFEASLKRVRHQWGLPSNPDGVGARLGKTVLDLNVLRLMGMVTWASLPDVGKIVMRNGIMRTFKTAFVPLISNLKELKMMSREARRMGVGIDVFTGMRAQGMLDVMDDLQRGTKFEKGVHYLTGRQGLLAGFSVWTDGMKFMAANVSNVRMLDSIARVMEGKASKKEIEFLAGNGINENLADRIWAEVQKGGGTKHNGVWLPNTEDWTDEKALAAFQAAVVREVNNTIVTPGLERALWVNASVHGRLLAQFKSFAMASTTKTVMAGIQQRDAAAVNGLALSLGLGVLSYYVSSLIKGGDAYDKMMNADLGLWADEAIDRSGMTAAFGIGQDLLSRIPATQPYVNFSGQRTSRRGGTDLVEALAGPTFGGLAGQAADVLMGIDDPTKSTVHKARQLLPYQNLHGIGYTLDQIEKYFNVKERRS